MKVKEMFLQSPLEMGESIAAGLLQIGAVELRPHEPFTWTSGWKSPIYCDNRLILGHPVLRDLVLQGFQSIIETKLPSVDLIVGTATAGIAPAGMLADRLGLPMAYVRGSAKEHGKQKRTEGKVVPGARAIIIEDTLSTGKSSYSAVEAVREEGMDVLAVFTVLSYDFEVARERAVSANVPAYRLVDYKTLIETAVAEGYVSDDDVELLMSWREAPDKFGV